MLKQLQFQMKGTHYINLFYNLMPTQASTMQKKLLAKLCSSNWYQFVSNWFNKVIKASVFSKVQIGPVQIGDKEETQ